VPGEGDAPLLKQLLAAKEIDMVTFTSSSTVINLLAMLGSNAGEQARLLDGVAVAAIGPITAATAREHGLGVTVEAEEYTIDGLVGAITNYYTDGGGKRVANDTL